MGEKHKLTKKERILERNKKRRMMMTHVRLHKQMSEEMKSKESRGGVGAPRDRETDEVENDWRKRVGGMRKTIQARKELARSRGKAVFKGR